MKVATEIAILAAPEKIWDTLLDFSAYPDWNRFIKAVRGQAAPDARLEMDMHYHGEVLRKLTGKVTGFMAPKYLSWAWSHAWGSWWMAAEHVFRIKQNESGKVIYFQETYYTGLGLRFRRRDIEHRARLSMEKMSEDLKERCEAAA
jgi:hypothetical protein